MAGKKRQQKQETTTGSPAKLAGAAAPGPPAPVPAAGAGGQSAAAVPAAAVPAAAAPAEPCWEYRLVTDEDGNPVYRMVEVPCK